MDTRASEAAIQDGAVGLAPNYYFNFGIPEDVLNLVKLAQRRINLQVVGERRDTRAKEQVLQIDDHFNGFKLILKESIKHLIKLDAINEISYDVGGQHTVQISCRDDRRYLLEFQNTEDKLLFRTACAAMRAGNIGDNKFDRTILRKGVMAKKSISGFKERFMVVVPRKLYIFTSEDSSFPRSVISLLKAGARYNLDRKLVFLDALGKQYVFRGESREGTVLWFTALKLSSDSSPLAITETEARSALSPGSPEIPQPRQSGAGSVRADGTAPPAPGSQGAGSGQGSSNGNGRSAHPPTPSVSGDVPYTRSQAAPAPGSIPLPDLPSATRAARAGGSGASHGSRRSLAGGGSSASGASVGRGVAEAVMQGGAESVVGQGVAPSGGVGGQDGGGPPPGAANRSPASSPVPALGRQELVRDGRGDGLPGPRRGHALRSANADGDLPAASTATAVVRPILTAALRGLRGGSKTSPKLTDSAASPRRVHPLPLEETLSSRRPQTGPQPQKGAQGRSRGAESEGGSQGEGEDHGGSEEGEGTQDTGEVEGEKEEEEEGEVSSEGYGVPSAGGGGPRRKGHYIPRRGGGGAEGVYEARESGRHGRQPGGERGGGHGRGHSNSRRRSEQHLERSWEEERESERGRERDGERERGRAGGSGSGSTRRGGRAEDGIRVRSRERSSARSINRDRNGDGHGSDVSSSGAGGGEWHEGMYDSADGDFSDDANSYTAAKPPRRRAPAAATRRAHLPPSAADPRPLRRTHYAAASGKPNPYSRKQSGSSTAIGSRTPASGGPRSTSAPSRHAQSPTLPTVYERDDANRSSGRSEEAGYKSVGADRTAAASGTAARPPRSPAGSVRDSDPAPAPPYRSPSVQPPPTATVAVHPFPIGPPGTHRSPNSPPSPLPPPPPSPQSQPQQLSVHPGLTALQPPRPIPPTPPSHSPEALALLAEIQSRLRSFSSGSPSANPPALESDAAAALRAASTSARGQGFSFGCGIGPPSGDSAHTHATQIPAAALASGAVVADPSTEDPSTAVGPWRYAPGSYQGIKGEVGTGAWMQGSLPARPTPPCGPQDPSNYHNHQIYQPPNGPVPASATSRQPAASGARPDGPMGHSFTQPTSSSSHHLGRSWHSRTKVLCRGCLKPSVVRHLASQTSLTSSNTGRPPVPSSVFSADAIPTFVSNTSALDPLLAHCRTLQLLQHTVSNYKTLLHEPHNPELRALLFATAQNDAAAAATSRTTPHALRERVAAAQRAWQQARGAHDRGEGGHRFGGYHRHPQSQHTHHPRTNHGPSHYDAAPFPTSGRQRSSLDIHGSTGKCIGACSTTAMENEGVRVHYYRGPPPADGGWRLENSGVVSRDGGNRAASAAAADLSRGEMHGDVYNVQYGGNGRGGGGGGGRGGGGGGRKGMGKARPAGADAEELHARVSFTDFANLPPQHQHQHQHQHQQHHYQHQQHPEKEREEYQHQHRHRQYYPYEKPPRRTSSSIAPFLASSAGTQESEQDDVSYPLSLPTRSHAHHTQHLPHTTAVGPKMKLSTSGRKQSMPTMQPVPQTLPPRPPYLSQSDPTSSHQQRHHHGWEAAAARVACSPAAGQQQQQQQRRHHPGTGFASTFAAANSAPSATRADGSDGNTGDLSHGGIGGGMGDETMALTALHALLHKHLYGRQGGCGGDRGGDRARDGGGGRGGDRGGSGGGNINGGSGGDRGGDRGGGSGGGMVFPASSGGTPGRSQRHRGTTSTAVTPSAGSNPPKADATRYLTDSQGILSLVAPSGERYRPFVNPLFQVEPDPQSPEEEGVGDEHAGGQDCGDWGGRSKPRGAEPPPLHQYQHQRQHLDQHHQKQHRKHRQQFHKEVEEEEHSYVYPQQHPPPPHYAQHYTNQLYFQQDASQTLWSGETSTSALSQRSSEGCSEDTRFPVEQGPRGGLREGPGAGRGGINAISSMSSISSISHGGFTGPLATERAGQRASLHAGWASSAAGARTAASFTHQNPTAKAPPPRPQPQPPRYVPSYDTPTNTYDAGPDVAATLSHPSRRQRTPSAFMTRTSSACIQHVAMLAAESANDALLEVMSAFGRTGLTITHAARTVAAPSVTDSAAGAHTNLKVDAKECV